MANECITNILFESSEEGINWLKALLDQAWSKKGEERFDFILENFGVEGKNNMEKLGARWVDLSDISIDEEGLRLNTTSANYPPNEMIKNIVEILREKFDSSSIATGKYWDENFNTIGIFECNRYGYMFQEDSVDVDFDNPDYWEEQVEPAFNNLEL